MEHGYSQQQCWIFGYGSLLWNPGFPFIEQHPAKVHGYHRSLCILSHKYRGTFEKPGLVLGLDNEGACHGMVFRIAPENVKEVLVYLDQREQVTKVYCPIQVSALCQNGETVKALTYVVRKNHEQYVQLSPQKQAQLVSQGVGSRGSALEYLSNTLHQLNVLGIEDTPLSTVLKLAQNCSVKS